MIETYKIVSGKYQPDVAPTLYKSSVHLTRGNDRRLEKSPVKYDLGKFSFSNRVVNIWNSLPNWVVSAASGKMRICGCVKCGWFCGFFLRALRVKCGCGHNIIT